MLRTIKHLQGLPSGPAGQESTCNSGAIGDVGLIPGSEDPLEEGMTTHFSILAGESHVLKNLVGYSPQGHKESDMTEVTEHTSIKH